MLIIRLTAPWRGIFLLILTKLFWRWKQTFRFFRVLRGYVFYKPLQVSFQLQLLKVTFWFVLQYCWVILVAVISQEFILPKICLQVGRYSVLSLRTTWFLKKRNALYTSRTLQSVKSVISTYFRTQSSGNESDIYHDFYVTH